jgi:hypothetical protein
VPTAVSAATWPPLHRPDPHYQRTHRRRPDSLAAQFGLGVRHPAPLLGGTSGGAVQSWALPWYVPISANLVICVEMQSQYHYLVPPDPTLFSVWAIRLCVCIKQIHYCVKKEHKFTIYFLCLVLSIHVPSI